MAADGGSRRGVSRRRWGQVTQSPEPTVRCDSARAESSVLSILSCGSRRSRQARDPGQEARGTLRVPRFLVLRGRDYMSDEVAGTGHLRRFGRRREDRRGTTCGAGGVVTQSPEPTACCQSQGRIVGSGNSGVWRVAYAARADGRDPHQSARTTLRVPRHFLVHPDPHMSHATRTRDLRRHSSPSRLSCAADGCDSSLRDHLLQATLRAAVAHFALTAGS